MNITALNRTDAERLKKLAAEFMVLQMSKWLSEEEKYNSLEEFNRKNNFGISQFSLFPFFTSIANGSFDYLYELFSPFYATEIGPISSVVLNIIIENDLEYFNCDAQEAFQIKVRLDKNVSSWMEIESNLLSIQLEGGDNKLANFSDIVFHDTEKKLVDCIKSSIEAIKIQTKNKFVTYDDFQIKTLARQHRSWSTIYSYYKNINGSTLKDFIIPKSEAAKDRKVFKALEDLPAN